MSADAAYVALTTTVFIGFAIQLLFPGNILLPLDRRYVRDIESRFYGEYYTVSCRYCLIRDLIPAADI